MKRRTSRRKPSFHSLAKRNEDNVLRLQYLLYREFHPYAWSEDVETHKERVSRNHYIVGRKAGLERRALNKDGVMKETEIVTKIPEGSASIEFYIPYHRKPLCDRL